MYTEHSSRSAPAWSKRASYWRFEQKLQRTADAQLLVQSAVDRAHEPLQRVAGGCKLAVRPVMRPQPLGGGTLLQECSSPA